MLARSLVAVLLSIPATIAMIGLLLALLPRETGLALPMLLLVFPAWVGVACGSYLLSRTWLAALILVAASCGGFGMIQLLKLAGMSAV
ncbi:MAG: hypothetical protein AAGI11_12615 [Pseudomonadota bacterium]